MTYLWRSVGLPEPTAEYRFASPRRFRFDWAWVYEKIAVEQEGGIWMRGRTGRGGAHSLPSNILRDMEKLNLAGFLGWRVFRFTPEQIIKGEAAVFMGEVWQAWGLKRL